MRPSCQRLQSIHAIFGAVIVMMLTGCATMDINVIAPPVADGTSQQARGRALYVGKCAKCHAPEPVQKYSVAHWDEIMPEMVGKTKLGAADAAAVMAYVKSLARE